MYVHVGDKLVRKKMPHCNNLRLPCTCMQCTCTCLDMYVADILTDQEHVHSSERRQRHQSTSKCDSTSVRRRNATKFPAATRVAAPSVLSADGIIPLQAPESEPAPLELIKQEEEGVGDVRRVYLFRFISFVFRPPYR